MLLSRWIVLLGLWSILTLSATAQTRKSHDVIHISPAEYERKVDEGIAVLKRNRPFKVDEAIALVLISNTQCISSEDYHKPSARDEEFWKLLWNRASAERLDQALGESIPNKGMGVYFKKYDLHWGGSDGNFLDRDRYVIDGEARAFPTK